MKTPLLTVALLAAFAAGRAAFGISQPQPSAFTPDMTNSLIDIGKLQGKDAGLPVGLGDMEDFLLKKGLIQSIDKFPPNGAVYHYPDGTIAWEDYALDVTTLPQTPEQVLRDPKAPPQLKSVAQKTLADNADKKEKSATAAKDCAMFAGSPECAKKNAAKTNSAKNDEDAFSAQSFGNPEKGGDVDLTAGYETGKEIGASSVFSPQGADAGKSGAKGYSPADPRAMRRAQNDLIEAGDNPAAARFTYTRLAELAQGQKGQALKQLKDDAAHPPTPPSDDKSAPAGSDFFNVHPKR